MKLLVTGGCGFIGSHFVKRALQDGHEVVNIDALTYAGRLENTNDISLHPKYKFEKINIVNYEELSECIFQNMPDAIVHLAAESHVDRSITGSKPFLETNIIGTYNLLEITRNYVNRQLNVGTFRFLHVSTDEVFGSLPENKSIKFKETSNIDPRSPYSASKACSDHLVSAWHFTYGLPTLITNCSNNYGPFHHPEKLIPKVILNAIRGDKIPIYGDGKNIRDWLYVEDHASALLNVLKFGNIGQRYNIGGECEVSNIDLVKIICQKLDNLRPISDASYFDQVEFVSDRLGHDKRYAIDSSKIQHELSWYPQTCLFDGLSNTIKWYLDNEDWWLPLV